MNQLSFKFQKVLKEVSSNTAHTQYELFHNDYIYFCMNVEQKRKNAVEGIMAFA